MNLIPTNIKKLLTLNIGLFISYSAIAQTSRDISGVVKDSKGTSIIAATVKYIAGKDTLFTRTDIDGNFIFKGVKYSTFLFNCIEFRIQGLK